MGGNLKNFLSFLWMRTHEQLFSFPFPKQKKSQASACDLRVKGKGKRPINE